MKIIVTGGAGFIGSHLVDKLVAQHHTVIVIDDLSTGKKENINKKAIFYNADIRDYFIIEKLFIGVKLVYHLAALPSVAFSIKNPHTSHDINVNGTVNVLNACQKHNISHIIYASSCAVYGETTKIPMHETDALNPTSPYALHKLIGEQYCQLYTNLYNIYSTSLRFFNVYGSRMADSGYASVIQRFLSKRKENQPLPIYGNGKQTRDFIYIDDVINALIAAQKVKINNSIMNIGTGKNITINELASLFKINDIIKLPERLEPHDSCADITKASILLNWKPQISLQEGIKML